MKKAAADARHSSSQRRRKRRRIDSAEDQQAEEIQQPQDKSYKICSVLGGLDVTRYVSRDARAFFGGAIDDVELIREVIGEAATNGGLGHAITLDELDHSLDWKGRGIDNKEETTVEAGLGYVDDRPDRRMDYYVSLAGGLAAGRRSNVEAELAMVQAAAVIFPWIVDRKARPDFWSVSHQNGRSEGPKKEPFRFDSLYTAAWIGSWEETWAYYPPLIKAGGIPYTVGDAVGPNNLCRECPFVKPNLPENNPERKAFFTSPYPDVAQTGLSIITALAPVYYTGIFRNHTYNDTYIASTGVDIEVQSVSSLLDVIKGRLTKGSFGVLVDLDLNVVVTSQDVVEMIYPTYTGFEDERITHDASDESVIPEDRRNPTYLVSDTIVQGLTELTNANWSSIKASLLDINPGERDFSTLSIVLTGEEDAIEYYVMYERWEYVADWAMLIFAPKEEVDNAMKVDILSRPKRKRLNQTSSSNLVLEGEKGTSLIGQALIVNSGTLDVTLTPRGTPSWLQMRSSIIDGEILQAGESLALNFDVQTEYLDLGSTSAFLSFNVRDDSYPDCFYNEEMSLSIMVRVLPQDCVRITGDKMRISDASGTTCVCRETSIEVGSRCISYGVVLPLVLIPLLVFGLLLVYTYVERKRKQADSVWEVKSSELIYSDPPEVAGCGTFGLVLIAEYRGTTVAVKRVIPPRMRYKGNGYESGKGDGKQKPRRRRSSLLGVLNNSVRRRSSLFSFDSVQDSGTDSMFDFDDERDEEKAVEGNGIIDGSRRASLPDEAVPLTATRRSSLDANSRRSSLGPKNRRSSLGMVPGSHRRLSVPDEVDSDKGRGNTSGYGSTSITVSSSMWGVGAGFASRYTDLKVEFVREMRHLSKLRHPCITTVMGSVISRWEEPLLVMEYMDHGSLHDLLHNETMIFEGEIVLPILRDIAQGLRFLHSASPQIIHGDLKAQNILIDAKFRAKVADFGFSVKKKVGASGTPYWMAPELLRRESGNSAASDVYSFGIVLYELFSRKDPYEGEEFENVIRDVCDPAINKRPPIPASMPAEVATLLYSTTLLRDPTARPTFEELDAFLKRFQAQNVDPGQQLISRQLKKAQDKSDRDATLLDELFPPHVATALRAGRKVEPEHFDCVTIFFSDIVGYTSISSQMSPLKVSDMLDRLYNKFDDLSHAHGVYKLETIGDAWMGVTNLFKPCAQDHVKRIALFSIDATQAANETLIDLDDPAKGFVEIRVGFHSGSVLANVVGSRLPKYSVFGDTVNTAARMESNSLPGRIQCSDRSGELLKAQAPEIPIKCRGEINVKGKGAVITFWVGEGSPDDAKVNGEDAEDLTGPVYWEGTLKD